MKIAKCQKHIKSWTKSTVVLNTSEIYSTCIGENSKMRYVELLFIVLVKSTVM